MSCSEIESLAVGHTRNLVPVTLVTFIRQEAPSLHVAKRLHLRSASHATIRSCVIGWHGALETIPDSVSPKDGMTYLSLARRA